MTACISDPTAEDFVSNRLGDDAREELLAHLDQCQRCRDGLLRRVILRQCPDVELPPLPDQSQCREVRPSGAGQWSTVDGSTDPDSPVDPQVDDGRPVEALVGKSLSQLASLSFPAERCPQCFASGLSEIGRLRVDRSLGEGGSSVVYLAYDPVLERQVALKLPRRPVFTSTSARERFLREARAAALLRHPNIVPVYGAGEVAGILHIELAYCPGPTLAQWLEQRRQETEAGGADSGAGAAGRTSPVSAHTAAGIVECLADAMEHAFQKGVLHRDIKPSNILLEPRKGAEGDEFPFTPMLSDFGLARLTDEQSDLTATGEVLGTPQYMAPEQASGQQDQIGPATDVYGLGAVLYELLTGSPPIQGRNYAETVMRVTSAEPTLPRQLAADVPRDIEAICLTCLRKPPHRRYQTPAELADDLRRFQAGEPTVARPVTFLSRALRWSGRHPAVAALILFILIALAVLIAAQGVYNLRLDNLNRELSDSLEQTHQAQQLSQRSELRAQQLLYASDIRLAMQAWKDLDLRQYHKSLERHSPRLRTGDLRGFEWSYLWRLGHAENVTLGTQHQDIYFARYSPDGRWIVTAGKDAIVRLYDARTGQETIELPTGQGEVNGAAFSPDSQRIATAGDDGTLRVWDLQTRRETVRIEGHNDLAYQVVFTPDGRLVSCGNEPDLRLWSAENGDSLGVLPGHEDNVEAIALAPDGWHLGSASKDHTVRLWDLRDQEKTRLLCRHPDPVTCLAFSQDGAFVATGTMGGAVYVHDMDSTEQIAWLRHLDDVCGVALSPNGRSIIVADRGGTVGLWRIPPKAKVPPIQKLTEPVAAWAAHPGRAWSVDLAPDGDQILSAGSDGSAKVWPTSRLPCWRDLDLHQRRDLDRLPKGWKWLAMVPERRTLVTAAGPHGMLLWDLSSVRWISDEAQTDSQPPVRGNVPLPEPAVLDPGPWIVTDVSADGRLLAGGNQQGEVAIWDLTSRDRRATWRLDPSRAIAGVAFSPDARSILAHQGHTVWLVQIDSQVAVRRFEMAQCNAAVFSPDGSRVAIARGNHAVLADAPHLDRQRALQRHTNTVCAIAFSPDGRLLASGGNDRTVNLWDAASGTLNFSLQGHRGRIVDVAFAPDGRSLVVADEAGTLKLWHVASGQELCDLDEVPAGYGCVGFLPNGQGLICGYGNHKVRLLDWGLPD